MVARFSGADPNSDGLNCTDAVTQGDPACDGAFGLTLYTNTSSMGADFGYDPSVVVGTIGDTLWLDNNDNGVRDAGEIAIARGPPAG